MPANVLMVAEKPSIAGAIATALGDGKAAQTKGVLPSWQWKGRFQGADANFVCTSVAGHVFSCDFPEEYRDWDAVDPATLFFAPVKKAATKGSVVGHLAECGRDVDYLVLWLDCDREGENICFEVMQIVQPKMRRGTHGQRIFRAFFSAVAPSDIRKAMACLGEPDANLSRAVDARQELDLKVGVAFSRFQTRFFTGRYGDLDASLISYGPCQTPTLGFCVDRHDLIQAFVPETYWTLDVAIAQGSALLPLTWTRGRVFDHSVAAMYLGMLQDAGSVAITNVQQVPGRRVRPLPLNTVEMLKLASRVLGMGPSTTMHVAERLYLRGILSYPRTESTAYPKSFDVRGTAAAHAAHPKWGAYVQEKLLQPGAMQPARKGIDAGDHPPITPVQCVSPASLSGDEARLYDFIARHFLASISQDCTFVTTRVSAISAGELFTAEGKQLVDAGFMEVLGREFQEVPVPDLAVGQTFEPSKLTLSIGRTKPPGHLTESELIGVMERNGIGTDASISTHVNNVVSRGYVSIGPNRTMVPSTLGIVLVHGYKRIDPDLVLPRVRSEIEAQCNSIAQGTARLEDVLAHALVVFEQKFKYFTSNITKMDELFEAKFSQLAEAGKPLSRCGKCGNFMTFMATRPQRLFCETCNETYNTPQNGVVKVWDGQRCPIDRFELATFTLGDSRKAQGKSFTFCPHCFNYPPFEGMASMGCNSCLHPTCKHSLRVNAVTTCPATGCPGLLVLDHRSKPNWKLVCNACDTLIRFSNEVTHLEANDDKCQCGAKLLNVRFRSAAAPPAAPGAGRGISSAQEEAYVPAFAGCPVCSDALNAHTTLVFGKKKHDKVRKAERARRGRGRGRGGGRGRGADRGGRGRGSSRGRS